MPSRRSRRAAILKQRGPRTACRAPMARPIAPDGGRRSGQASTTTGMIMGRRRCLSFTHLPSDPAHDLLQRVRVGVALAQARPRRPPRSAATTSSKTVLVLDEPAGLDLRAAGDLAVDESTTTKHGDEPLRAQHPAVLQRGLGDVADAGAVDVHVAARDRADDRWRRRRRGRRRRRPRRAPRARAGTPVSTASSALARRCRHSPWTGMTLRGRRCCSSRAARRQRRGRDTCTIALPLCTTFAPRRVSPLMTRRRRSRCRGSARTRAPPCRPRRPDRGGRGWRSATAPPSARPATRCRPARPASSGRSSSLSASMTSPAGTVQVAELARDAHVAHHRPTDEGDLAAVQRARCRGSAGCGGCGTRTRPR